MLAEYEGVFPLVSNPRGWSQDEVKVYHRPIPNFTPELEAALEAARQRTIDIRTKPPYQDTNGDKAAVRRLVASDNQLLVETFPTKYFDLWGLPGAAPNFHRQALEELSRDHATEIPIGISTHNIVLLTPDGNKTLDDITVAMIVNDPRHGFAPGRLSISYEGQLDPSVDLEVDLITPSTFLTVTRTLGEEFGIGLDQSPIGVDLSDLRLVAVCAEKGSAYTSWCHIAWIKGHSEDLAASYQLAPRRRDANALLAIPLREIDTFASDLTINQHRLSFLIAGSLPEGTELQVHPTVPWRVDALKDYLAETT